MKWVSGRRRFAVSATLVLSTSVFLSGCSNSPATVLAQAPPASAEPHKQGASATSALAGTSAAASKPGALSFDAQGNASYIAKPGDTSISVARRFLAQSSLMTV